MRKFIDWDNISDDEIRIIGDHKEKSIHRKRWGWVIITLLAIGLIILITTLIKQNSSNDNGQSPTLFDTIETLHEQETEDNNTPFIRSFCEVRDTTINNLPLRLFIPYNAEPTLHRGKIDRSDSSIVYVNMAADLRADNGGILGAFVLEGNPLAWGLSRRGYCSIIEDVVTVGVADNSPLFERATEIGGHFFRQYPLVDNGKVSIETRAKVYNYLRALCQIGDNTFMVHSLAKVSFENFAKALIDLGCDNAIYIVGYQSYGWARDQYDTIHEFGIDGYYENGVPTTDNINYIVWRKQQYIN